MVTIARDRACAGRQIRRSPYIYIDLESEINTGSSANTAAKYAERATEVNPRTLLLAGDITVLLLARATVGRALIEIRTGVTVVTCCPRYRHTGASQTISGVALGDTRRATATDGLIHTTGGRVAAVRCTDVGVVTGIRGPRKTGAIQARVVQGAFIHITARRRVVDAGTTCHWIAFVRSALVSIITIQLVSTLTLSTLADINLGADRAIVARGPVWTRIVCASTARIT